MDRRTFLAATLALLAARRAVTAQPTTRIPLVGVVVPPPQAPSRALDAFRRGLSELRYVEGQNVRLEIRQWDGTSGHSPALVGELVRIQVDVLVVPTTGAAIAAQRATSTIPIVAASAGALLESGAIGSLARPGGNVTGLTAVQPDLARKRLDLLKEALPGLSRVAVLMSPYREVPSVGERLRRETEVAAAALKLRLQLVRVEAAADLETGFQSAAQRRAEAGVILPNPFWGANAARVGALSLRHRLPLMVQDPGLVDAGALMQYGVDLPDLWRQAATYVDKILRGAKPADLPVEQPTKFELVINLKTAKALGLTIPPSVLARADEVIE